MWAGLLILCQALGCIPEYPVDLRSAVLSAQLMNRWWCRNLALHYKGCGGKVLLPHHSFFSVVIIFLLNFIWGEGGKRKLSTWNPRHWFPSSHTKCGLEIIRVLRWLFNCSLETSGEFYPASFILNASSAEGLCLRTESSGRSHGGCGLDLTHFLWHSSYKSKTPPKWKGWWHQPHSRRTDCAAVRCSLPHQNLSLFQSSSIHSSFNLESMHLNLLGLNQCVTDVFAAAHET